MIEFDEHHEALDAVIEDARRLCAAYPGEMRVVEVSQDLCHFDRRMPIVHVPDIFIDQCKQLHLLFGCKF